jgi:lipopolysaccharide biosynthesis glycosyltransferase
LIIAEADLIGAQSLVRCFHPELDKQSIVKRHGNPRVLIHKMKPTSVDRNITTTSAPFWVQRFWETPAAYVRLHLHEYLPGHITQALWLDTDTVVQGDISQLLRRSMRHPIAAAYDKKPFSAVYSEWVSAANAFLPSRFDKTEMFFNSGVLMINLALWRKGGIAQRLEEMASRILGVDDQFLLNMVFYHDFDVLDEKWNLLGLGEPSAFWEGLRRPSSGDIEAAQILHFTGCCKPPADPQGRKGKCVSDYEDVYQKYRVHNVCTDS